MLLGAVQCSAPGPLLPGIFLMGWGEVKKGGPHFSHYSPSYMKAGSPIYWPM